MSSPAGAAAPAQKAPNLRRRGSVAAEDDEAFKAYPFAKALAREPHARCEVSVRDALDGWLETLPVQGAELALDLRAPREALLETFRRGRLGIYPVGAKVMEEGEDVRHYTIVLQGRINLRCKPPKEPDGSVAVPASCLDKDSLALCDSFGRGEALGLLPTEGLRSAYEASAVEKSLLLLLSAHDYSACLGSFHQSLLTETADFLLRHRLCPNAGPTQLARLATLCRLRSARRGSVLEQAGASQRYVRFLISGVAALSLPKDDAAAVGAEAQPEDAAGESSQSEDERERLSRLRDVAGGGREGQQAAAAEGKHLAAVLKYSRGKSLRRALQKRPRTPPKPAAVVSRCDLPGAVLGEEILLFDSLKEAITARSCYTIRAETDCIFYTLDLTTWRSMNMYMGQENLTSTVDDRMQRRTQMLGRSHSVERRVNQAARRTQRREAARENRQQIRLPGCCGTSSVKEVSNLNDWLSVTFNYRKAPMNEKNPCPLVCLNALNIDPATMSKGLGPGVDSMLKAFADDGTAKKVRLEDVQRPRRRWARQYADRNPMGDTFPANANYLDASIPMALALEGPSYDEIPPAPADGGVGTSFMTDLDLDDTERMPRVQAPQRSSSVPTLPQLSAPPGAPDEEMQRSVSSLSLAAPIADFKRGGNSGRSGSPPLPRPARDHRDRKVAKAFSRAAAGKNVLVLSDAADVMKTVSNVMLSANLGLFFAKSTNELFKRFADPKEQWHALFVDLNKRETQVETLLKTIRGHSKYSKIPIVVISSERELSDLVRQECSFVVFKPLALPTLREALLWCFDRRALDSFYKPTAGATEVSKADVTNLALGAGDFTAVNPIFGKTCSLEVPPPPRPPPVVSPPTA
eukprot:TRINITY_DN114105_c0_g1_i1.p1 TRINITY_DN114105_c0_g1~~TRINITY_DN114105_c0_g1_i1.p1  ORF type:complete len:863 (-),score=199.20 TRINITY_DN114105_c0_g1_i1:175-2763(-)